MEETEDFIKELGYLGFTTRLQRISDALMHEGRKLYADLDIDIEPNWFVVFKLLKSYGPMCVTDIADRIKMAHPSVITITNKMVNAGYLHSERDPLDSRKRVLNLSDKALKRLPEFERIWQAVEQAVAKSISRIEALDFITELENEFWQQGFKARTLHELKIIHRTSKMIVKEEIALDIINYEEQYRENFTQLNFEWLEKYFYIEDYDRKVLTDPETYILNPGGYILFALVKQEVVGTVALIHRGEEGYELSKMAVTEKYKGLGFGLKLMEACLDFAKSKGMSRVFLDSNTKLTPAINLYHKVGFVEIPVPQDTPYERCNIRMEILLDPKS